MAFSFGAAPATPAPAFGSTPAPTPAFGFGSTTPAPAPSGGLFGSSTPAPAPSGGLFGSSTPAPAPSTGGFSFGGTPAPAPSGSIFGSTPAPATTGFGTTTSSTSPFSQPATQPAQQQQPQMMMITSSTPYSSLPVEAQRAIDTIHDEIMRHKKTMQSVETMAPVELQEPTKPADAAAGGSSKSNLQQELHELQHSLQGLSTNIHASRQQALVLQKQMETSTTQSVMYGLWPVEAVAVRRGVKLTSKESASDPSVRAQLQNLLNAQVAHVDRVERIPSPYFWQTLEELERRIVLLQQQVSSLDREVDAYATEDIVDVAAIVHSQGDAIARVAHDVTRVHASMELLRKTYRRTERGENVLDKAHVAEYERQLRLEQQAKQQYMKAASAAPQQQQTTTTAPAPSGGLFGGTPAPAPSGGLFGSSAPAPAPSGGLFGSSAPAPAPTGGGLFGSTTTPAPAPGATPAPASGGLFGSTTTTPAPAAPATGGGLFGSTTTPAPAPVGTGAPPAPSLFGTSTPAPAPGGFSFGGSSASTPRMGSTSRSRNRSSRR